MAGTIRLIIGIACIAVGIGIIYYFGVPSNLATMPKFTIPNLDGLINNLRH